MIWITVLSVVISVIEHLPEMITVFKEIIDFLKTHPFHVGSFAEVIGKHQQLINPDEAAADFKTLHLQFMSIKKAGL